MCALADCDHVLVCIGVYVCVYVQCVYVARRVCALYIITHSCLPVLVFSVWYAILEKNAPVSCMDLFSTLRGEGTFVRVGVKTEFIASWLPPRMRTATMMGHREEPPSQRGPLLRQGKRKDLPRVAFTTGGCKTRESSDRWACEDQPSCW